MKKPTEAELLQAEQEQNASVMRDMSAKNAWSIQNGEMNAGSIPAGNVSPVETVATLDNGMTVEITVYEATYGGERQLFATANEGRRWMRDQRKAWEQENLASHYRLQIRCRAERLAERVEELRRDASEWCSDETLGILFNAVAMLGISSRTIGENGEQLTISEAKDGVVGGYHD